MYLFLHAAKASLADPISEFSSHVSAAQRAANLASFQQGKTKVLVASDAMTRGMDVTGVANVINYDAPVHATTYLHRVGRTGRAGQSGRAFTLLKHEDVRHFKNMLRKVDNTYVKDYKIANDTTAGLQSACQTALQSVQDTLAGI